MSSLHIASVRGGVVQDAPCVFDRGRTLEQVANLTADAARQGARLVVFPEAFVSGYPRSAGTARVPPEIARLSRPQSQDHDGESRRVLADQRVVQQGTSKAVAASSLVRAPYIGT